MTDCARPQWVTKPSDDLWNNTLMIAKRDPNVPVLILEDDVQFLPRVNDYAQHIDEIVANNKCELYSLGLGCALSFPLINDTRVVIGGGSHAILYSANGRQHLIREYGDNPSYKDSIVKNIVKNIIASFGFPWLHDGEIYYELHTLAPKEPCAIQSFPLTDNQKEWANIYTNTVFYLTGARDDGTFLHEINHTVARYIFGFIPLIILIFCLIIKTIHKMCIKKV